MQYVGDSDQAVHMHAEVVVLFHFFQIHYCSFDCSFAVPRCISVPTGGSCLFFGADGRWRAGEVAFASPGQAPCPQVDMQIECTQAIAMIYFSVCAGQASAGNAS